jgi:hypothetical protein
MDVGFDQLDTFRTNKSKYKITTGAIFRHFCDQCNSSVGIATRYELDGPEIESRWGLRFSALVQTGSGAQPASYPMGTGSFQGVKRPGRGAHTHPI